MGFVIANHDTENSSNDLPIYLVLYESLTMLEKKKKSVVGADESEEPTLDAFLSNFYFYMIWSVAFAHHPK